MSKSTPSPPYNEEECADMIKCYLDSGKNMELTQIHYVNRYPSRRKPKLYILEKVVQNYLKTLESSSTFNSQVEGTKSALVKDDRIVKYFINNSHATAKKAASIFGVQVCYINNILKERKSEIEAQQNANEVMRKELSTKVFLRQNRKIRETLKEIKQEQNESEKALTIKVKKKERNIEEERDCVLIYIENIKTEPIYDAIGIETSMSETPDVTICNVSTNRETDDDNDICCETESNKKRKRKYSNRVGNKKLRTFEEIQSSEDSNILEKSQMYNPIVYTTRLEDMAILHKKLKHINNALILNDILWESKPKYMAHRSNRKVKRTMSFKLLTMKLKKLYKNETLIDLTQEDDYGDADDPMQNVNEVIRKEQSSKDFLTQNRKSKKSQKKNKQEQNESDVTPDVTICNETTNRETDDDNDICFETESILKRKINYSELVGNKKLRTFEDIQRSEDPNILEKSQMHNFIVYTTRLEEMAILHKKLKHLNNALILNDILWESKPKYMAHRLNTKVKRTMSFTLLTKKLKKLNKNETIIDITQEDDDAHPMITRVVPIKCYTFNAKEEVLIDSSKKNNIIIVINNLFSKIYDIYVTDKNANIIDYYCIKSSELHIIKHMEQSKIRLTLDMCCWFRRQNRIESIWPRHEYPFSRFLTTTHKCPPGVCTCCCKPQQKQSTEVILHKSYYNTGVFTDNYNTKSDEYNKSLISAALKYKYPEVNKNNYARSDLEIGSVKRFLFLHYLLETNLQIVKNEFYEVGGNQEVIRFHADVHWSDRVRCYPCVNLITMSGVNADKIIVCCQWKRDFFLYAKYEEGEISRSTLRFLKKTLFPYICEKCNKNVSPVINKTQNVDIKVPKIEHTRISAKHTLLKIGYNTSPEINSCQKITVTNLTQNLIMNELKTAYNIESVTSVVETPVVMSVVQTPIVMAEAESPIVTSVVGSPIVTSVVETPKITSTVKINVSCKQIPELLFVFGGVDYQIATEIMTKFKHTSLTVKEDKTVIASSSSVQSLSSEVFQVFAQILQNIQYHLQPLSISAGSAINLELKIDNYTENDHTFKNINQGIDVASGSSHAGNKLLPYKLNDTIAKPSKQMPYNKYNINKCSQNELHVSKQTSNSSLNDRRPKGLAPSCSGRRNFDSDKLEAFDNFATVIRCSKKCYADSFNFFLKAKHYDQEENMGMPKITNVFSLQSLPTENDALDNMYTETSIPSTSYNNNIEIQNNCKAPPLNNLPPAGLVYDPLTKIMQLVNLAVPDANTMPDGNSQNTVLMGNNPSFAILTPVTLIPVSHQATPLKSQMPDLINDIPTDNYCVIDGIEHTIVKNESASKMVRLSELFWKFG